MKVLQCDRLQLQNCTAVVGMRIIREIIDTTCRLVEDHKKPLYESSGRQQLLPSPLGANNGGGSDGLDRKSIGCQ